VQLGQVSKETIRNCSFGRLNIISKNLLSRAPSPIPVIMKILESQSAVLTNYEVYNHLVEQEERYERRKKERFARLKEKEREGAKPVKFNRSDRRPGNLATLSIEVQCLDSVTEIS
jgi:hypothetical protein